MNSGSSQSRSGLRSGTKSKIDYCFYYNRFPNPRKCLSNQKTYKFDRVHSCSVCDKSSCASFKDRNRSQAQLNFLSTSHSESQVEITSKITEGFDKFTNKIDQISNFRPPTSSVNTMSCDSGSQSNNVPMFEMRSLVTRKVDLPNLANKHIMWCNVQSGGGGGGIDLSLPSDSCCSVTLCSLEHAKHMQAKCPDYKWVKLPSPILIHVANEDAGLQGIGMQYVRIDWGPGESSIHTMLVVPKLSFPVLLENNHLQLCDAVVSHKDSVVHLRHSTMQFKIKCPSEPPHWPNGTVETNAVSLFVHSEKPQKLQHGINFVTLCFSLVFLSGFWPMLSMRNPGMVTELTALNQYISGYGDNFWLTHSDKFVSDDLFVVPGPLTLKDLSKYTVGIQQNTHTHC